MPTTARGHCCAHRRWRLVAASSAAGFKSPLALSLRFMDEFQWFLMALSVLRPPAGRTPIAVDGSHRCHNTSNNATHRTKANRHSPSRKALRYFCPAIAQLLVRVDDDGIFLRRPRVLANGRVQVVVPPVHAPAPWNPCNDACTNAAPQTAVHDTSASTLTARDIACPCAQAAGGR